MIGVRLRPNPTTAASRGGRALTAGVGPRALLASLSAPAAQDNQGAAAVTITEAAERATAISAGTYFTFHHILMKAYRHTREPQSFVSLTLLTISCPLIQFCLNVVDFDDETLALAQVNVAAAALCHR